MTIRTPDDERPDWRDDADDWRRVERHPLTPANALPFVVLGLVIVALAVGWSALSW